MQEVYIVSIARTPIGSFNGSLTSVGALQLGATVINEAVKRAGIDILQVQELLMGNVLSANLGQAPARQAGLLAGLSEKTTCTTINKVCASGMKAIMLGTQSIRLGDSDIVVAGGMESMSNVPYYVPFGRWGGRYGNGEFIDGIVRDGLQDPYKLYMMGNTAEICAAKYAISRQEQDEYAIASYQRATDAYKNGCFNNELVPISVPQRKGDPLVVKDDDEYKNILWDKVSKVSPAFQKDGTVTAINASKINDGAAAVVLMSKNKADALGIKPLAKIRSYADAEQAPEWFTTTPAKAMPLAINKAGLSLSNIDLFEINEAFSVVAIANMREMQINHSQLNIFGGAVALGHPVGTSGARIVCTLISALQYKGKKLGAAAICNGGGGASAIVIELM